jgi:hypothetical protein
VKKPDVDVGRGSACPASPDDLGQGVPLAPTAAGRGRMSEAGLAV